MEANATRIGTDKLLYPTFPLKCVACEAVHGGHIDKAIDDGWHVTVFDTKSDGLVQFAGCPEHFQEWDSTALSYLKSKHSDSK